MASLENTFIVNKTCPVCGKSTRVVKVRGGNPIKKTDEDFCVHYQGDFNPYFYHIWVCEFCSYAADEKTFIKKMSESCIKKLKNFLSKENIHFEFSLERDMPEAVASYRLASIFADLQGSSLYTSGGIFLRIAWLYRFVEEREKECEYLQKAVNMYERSQMTEYYPQGNMTGNGIAYLIAAIYYRLGNREICMRHLSRLRSVNNLRIMDPKVYDNMKKLWENVREEQKDGTSNNEEKSSTKNSVEKGKKKKRKFGLF